MFLFFLIALSVHCGVYNTTFQCGDFGSVKNDFLLGMDILNPYQGGTYQDNMALASSVGTDFIHLHLDWNLIETSPGVYVDPFDGSLASFNSVAESMGWNFSLTLRPIDLGSGKTVPEDLWDVRWNNETLIKRFCDVIDFCFTKMNYEILTSLQIGNEIDGYDIARYEVHPNDFWSDYGNFLYGVKLHTSTHYPGLKIGFTAMFPGLMSTEPSSPHQLGVWDAYLNVVDVLGVTYYPHLSEDQTGQSAMIVKPSSLIVPDWDDFMSEYGSDARFEIMIQEAGYETSRVNNGSEYAQGAFVCEMLKVVEKYPSDVRAMLFVRMCDWDNQTSYDMASVYGAVNVHFAEYLRTLGMVTLYGTEKLSLKVLRDPSQVYSVAVEKDCPPDETLNSLGECVIMDESGTIPSSKKNIQILSSILLLFLFFLCV